MYGALLRGSMEASGDTDARLRKKIARHARDVTMGRTVVSRLGVETEHFLDLLARQPATIGDGDVEALRKAGHSDGAIVEITVAAAVGCGLQRLELARRLVGGGTE